MTFHRQLLAASVAAGAFALAGPALAQEMTYEYAQPAPAAPSVVYTADPVVQPIPTPPAPPAPPPAAQWHSEAGADYTVDRAEPLPAPPPPHHAYPAQMPGYAPAMQPGPGYAAHMPTRFDREAWLDNCQDRLRGVKEKDRAGVIGGLLGAVAGGIAGNRIAGTGERLAGSLIGAGVGGLAGIAIGSAIGASQNHKRRAECEAYLDRYMTGYPQPGGYGYPYAYGYPAYGYTYAYTMVPVMIAVPQRRVVRETVIEEWVDVPAHTVTRERKIYRPAPKADKRIKYTKTR